MKLYRTIEYDVLFVMLLGISGFTYLNFHAATFILGLRYLGMVASLLALFWFFFSKPTTAVTTSTLGHQIQQGSLLILLQLLFGLLLLGLLPVITFVLPHEAALLPQPIAPHFQTVLQDVVILQPWSFMCLLALRLYHASHRWQRAASLKYGFSPYLKQYTEKKWSWTIAYVGDLALQMAIFSTLTFFTLLICVGVARLLHIPLLHGITLPTLLLTVGSLLPFNTRLLSRMIRYFNFRRLPLSVYLSITISYLVLLIVSFSAVIEWAYRHLPHVLPSPQMITMTPHPWPLSLRLFCLGWMFTAMLFYSSVLARCLKGLSTRVVIATTALIPGMIMSYTFTHWGAALAYGLTLKPAILAGIMTTGLAGIALLVFLSKASDYGPYHIGALKRYSLQTFNRPTRFMRFHLLLLVAITMTYLLNNLYFFLFFLCLPVVLLAIFYLLLGFVAAVKTEH